MRIELGAPVMAAAGQRVGRVRRLVVDPATGGIPYFVLERGPFAAELLVPVTAIAAIEGGGALGLCLDANQVAALPRFPEEDFVGGETPAPPPLQHASPSDGALLPLEARSPGVVATLGGVPSLAGGDTLSGARMPQDELIAGRSSPPVWGYVLGRCTEVRTSDGWQVGRIDAIELAVNGRTQTLIVHSPFLRTPRRVPFAAISSGGPEWVVIGMGADQYLQQEGGEMEASVAPTLG